MIWRCWSVSAVSSRWLRVSDDFSSEDVERARPVEGAQAARGQAWTHWDVRLAKIVRSLWLFECDELMLSMQKFARTVKPHGGFRYGSVALDELFPGAGLGEAWDTNAALRTALRRALFGGNRSPAHEGSFSGIDRTLGFCSPGLGHPGDAVAGARVDDIDLLAAGRVHPLSIDQGLGLQQCRILEVEFHQHSSCRKGLRGWGSASRRYWRLLS